MFCFHPCQLFCLFVHISMKLDGRMGHRPRKNPLHFGLDPDGGIFYHFVEQWGIWLFFFTISGNGDWFQVCVQFGADSNKNLDVVNLHVVSQVDCWALADVCLFQMPFLFYYSLYCMEWFTVLTEVPDNTQLRNNWYWYQYRNISIYY